MVFFFQVYFFFSSISIYIQANSCAFVVLNRDTFTVKKNKDCIYIITCDVTTQIH